MAHLLHLDSSARTTDSISRQLTATFAHAEMRAAPSGAARISQRSFRSRLSRLSLPRR